MSIDGSQRSPVFGPELSRQLADPSPIFGAKPSVGESASPKFASKSEVFQFLQVSGLQSAAVGSSQDRVRKISSPKDGGIMSPIFGRGIPGVVQKVFDLDEFKLPPSAVQEVCKVRSVAVDESQSD